MKKKRVPQIVLIVVLILLAAVCCISGFNVGEDTGRSSLEVQETELILIQHNVGIAIIEFTNFTAHEESEASYRWRFRARDTGTEQSGQGKVFEKDLEIPLPGPNRWAIDTGSETTITAGPFNIEWSYASPHSGWIYYYPDTLSVVKIENEDFDTYDLSQVLQTGE